MSRTILGRWRPLLISTAASACAASLVIQPGSVFAQKGGAIGAAGAGARPAAGAGAAAGGGAAARSGGGAIPPIGANGGTGAAIQANGGIIPDGSVIGGSAGVNGGNANAGVNAANANAGANANAAAANANALNARNAAANAAANGAVNPGMSNAATMQGGVGATGAGAANAAQLNAARQMQMQQAAKAGSISGLTSSGFRFNNGTSTRSYSFNAQTAVTLNGQPTSLSKLPSNAQVQVVPSPTNAGVAQQVIATTPQASAAGSANTATAGTTTGTGTTARSTNGTASNGTATTGNVNGTTTNTTDPATGLPTVDPNAPGPGQIPGSTGPIANGQPGVNRPMLPPPAQLFNGGTAANNSATISPTNQNATTNTGTTGTGSRNFPGFGNDVAGTVDRQTGVVTPNPTAATQNTAAAQSGTTSQTGTATAGSTSTGTTGQATTSTNPTGFTGGIPDVPQLPGPRRAFPGFGNDVAGTVDRQTGVVTPNSTATTDAATKAQASNQTGTTSAAATNRNVTSGDTSQQTAQPNRNFPGFGNDVAGTVDRQTGVVTPNSNVTTDSATKAAASNQTGAAASTAATNRNIAPGDIPQAPQPNRNFPGFGNDVAGTVNPTTGQVQPSTTGTTSSSATATTNPTAASGATTANGTASFRSPGPIQSVLKVPDVNFGGTLQATSNGLRLSDVSKSGLAASAKLRNGDVIQSVNGQSVTSSAGLSYELQRFAAGDTVKLGISRNGKTTTESLKLPADHQAVLQNSTTTFEQANAAAMKQGATTSNPQTVEPSRESINNLTEENARLRSELDGSAKPNP
jgi:hypothetical protein